MVGLSTEVVVTCCQATFNPRTYWRTTPRTLCRPFDSSPIIAQTGTHPVEPSFVCDGVRLEIRQFRRSCRSLHKDAAPDRSETTTSSEHEDKLPGDTSHVSATVAKALPVPGGQTPPGGNSDTAFGNQQPNRGPVEEAEDTANVCELLPQVAPALPARSGGAGVNNDDSAASAGATCHRRPAPVVFCQELSHLELDVLLRPKLRWKDPLEVRLAVRNRQHGLSTLDLQ